MSIRVRPIQRGDAEAYIELLSWLDNESRYPVVNLLERSMNAADWRDAIDLLHREGQRIILLAEEVEDPASSPEERGGAAAGGRGRLVGFLNTTSDRFGGIYELRIVIGMREAYTGQGIGTRLFTELEAWARQAGVSRLHLTVETDNARALGLYHKMGFQIEGHISRAVQIQGRWLDDYVMAKWLDR